MGKNLPEEDYVSVSEAERAECVGKIQELYNVFIRKCRSRSKARTKLIFN